MPAGRKQALDKTSQPRHELIYAETAAYALGFAEDTVEEQCGFLAHLSGTLGRGRLESYLEICCGPAFHAQNFANQGVRAYGIDFSADMTSYAAERALTRHIPDDSELVTIGATGMIESEPVPPLPYVLEIKTADLTDFSVSEAADLAFCPRNQFRYLLKREDIISHFVSVAKNLGRGGLYVLEMDHPAHLFTGPGEKLIEWTRNTDEGSVGVKIESGGDPFDPINQVLDQRITLRISEGEGDACRKVTDRAPVRLVSYQELQLLVQQSGVFELVASFGDLLITQPFDNSPGSRCMVPVLRCSV
jgi:hypothetical protein